MLYAILCYDSEDVVGSWTKEQDDAVMARLAVVHDSLAEQGKLGPVARLLPTTAATPCARGDERRWSSTGPSPRPRSSCSASTSSTARRSRRRSRSRRDLGAANPGGAYEIRPIRCRARHARGAA